MGKFVNLSADALPKLRDMDERLVSYNVEMTEVTGGTFWKAYTQAQVDGTEPFEPIKDVSDLGNLQQWYDPIDLYNPRLRQMAKELGTAWVRVSGTWANKTYYDFDGHCNGKVPDGFQNLLTKDQWIGVLEFVKSIDGKLLVSVANCPGIHTAEEPWNPEQTKLLFDFSKEYGVPIAAAEFTNEPNAVEMSGLPVGYTVAQFNRDHDLFVNYIHEHYPETMIVGPCTVGGDFNIFADAVDTTAKEPVPSNVSGSMLTTDDLLGACEQKVDTFSYHYYNGISERGALMGGHWSVDQALTEKYLAVAGISARFYVPYRDKYSKGRQMWVTESGDAGAGGNTWASTYIDVIRTLNELGEFSTITDGIIFHNTLASSDYGYLAHSVFTPRPNYFAVLLWKKLMGTAVYDTGIANSEGAHVYAHSRKDGKDGVVYLIINNSAETTTVNLPKDAERYTLSGNGKLRSREMCLNGTPLVLGENDTLPEMNPAAQAAGEVELAPGTCTFFVM